MSNEIYPKNPFRTQKLARDWRALEHRAIHSAAMGGSCLVLYALLVVKITSDMGLFIPLH
jgi:hypothetical protein